MRFLNKPLSAIPANGSRSSSSCSIRCLSNYDLLSNFFSSPNLCSASDKENAHNNGAAGRGAQTVCRASELFRKRVAGVPFRALLDGSSPPLGWQARIGAFRTLSEPEARANKRPLGQVGIQPSEGTRRSFAQKSVMASVAGSLLARISRIASMHFNVMCVCTFLETLHPHRQVLSR